MSVSMLVETYECEETFGETPEMTKKALELIESLGLVGQFNMIKTGEGKDLKDHKRNPFRVMTQEEKDVWETLCPERCEVKEYGNSPIPVRVMQVISYAKDLCIFDEIQIWDKISSTIKDPVVVARIGQYEWQSESRFFILARWGEELDEWPAMLNKAAKIMKERVLTSVSNIQVLAKRKLYDFQQRTDREFIGMSIPRVENLRDMD